MKKTLTRGLCLALAAVLLLPLCGCNTSGGENSAAGGFPPATIYTLDDLAGKKLAVQVGSVADALAEGVEEAAISYYSNFADAVKELKSGTVDAVILDEYAALRFAEEDASLRIVEETYHNETYAVAVAHEATELKEKLNAALRAMKEDGTLDGILQNYVGDKRGTCPYETPAGTTYPNGKLIVAMHAFFDPFEYFEGDTIVGLDVMLAQALGDRLGMKVEIHNMAFESILKTVAEGKAHCGISAITVTDERLETVDFTVGYADSRQVVLVRAG